MDWWIELRRLVNFPRLDLSPRRIRTRKRTATKSDLVTFFPRSFVRLVLHRSEKNGYKKVKGCFDIESDYDFRFDRMSYRAIVIQFTKTKYRPFYLDPRERESQSRLVTLTRNNFTRGCFASRNYISSLRSPSLDRKSTILNRQSRNYATFISDPVCLAIENHSAQLFSYRICDKGQQSRLNSPKSYRSSSLSSSELRESRVWFISPDGRKLGRS